MLNLATMHDLHTVLKFCPKDLLWGGNKCILSIYEASLAVLHLLIIIICCPSLLLTTSISAAWNPLLPLFCLMVTIRFISLPLWRFLPAWISVAAPKRKTKSIMHALNPSCTVSNNLPETLNIRYNSPLTENKVKYYNRVLYFRFKAIALRIPL